MCEFIVHSRDGAFIAQIAKQHKAADTYRPEEPWLLLHKSGRVDRFDSLSVAKAEARKSWPRCTFKRTGQGGSA